MLYVYKSMIDCIWCGIFVKIYYVEYFRLEEKKNLFLYIEKKKIYNNL